jgi:hypothetical protein
MLYFIHFPLILITNRWQYLSCWARYVKSINTTKFADYCYKIDALKWMVIYAINHWEWVADDSGSESCLEYYILIYNRKRSSIFRKNNGYIEDIISFEMRYVSVKSFHRNFWVKFEKNQYVITVLNDIQIDWLQILEWAGNFLIWPAHFVALLLSFHFLQKLSI